MKFLVSIIGPLVLQLVVIDVKAVHMLLVLYIHSAAKFFFAHSDAKNHFSEKEDRVFVVLEVNKRLFKFVVDFSLCFCSNYVRT